MNKRAAPRVPITLEIKLRKPGYRKCSVDLLDISPTGCRMELPERVARGETVWVTLPGLEPLQSKVVWVWDWVAGLEFSKPIHPTLFEFHLSRMRK